MSANEEDKSFLVFECSNLYWAFQISYIDQIAFVQKVHSLPHKANTPIRGISNIGGELLLTIDLSKLLKKGDSNNECKSSNAIVCAMNDFKMVFLANFVYEIISDKIKYRDDDCNSCVFENGYIVYKDKVCPVLDCELLMTAIQRSYL